MKWVVRVLAGMLIVALLAMPQIPFAQQALWVRVIGYTGLYIILGIGLNVILGFGGLLHLGFVTFYAIGAYTYAILASDFFGYHLSFWLVLPLGALLAAFAGVLLGVPVLRTRGDYLAIVTLAFGEITRILITNLRSLTNGSQGLIGIDDPVFFGRTFDSGKYYYYLIFIFALLVIFITSRLRKSRIGRAWNAMREDEDVARMTGINTSYYKLLAFAVGGFIGGLAGVIFAAWQGSIFPDNFNIFVSVNVLCLIIIGGVGSIPGVIVGALALIALPDILRQFAEYRLLLFGLLLVVMMILRPAGFLPSKRLQIELGQTRAGPTPEKIEPANSSTGGNAS
ncbi:MAG: ABC transporter ATP-binding protein [Anaerolineae bacterium]|nr:ABC transporter ATP-binding protein [Anaerolineae bacterium]